MVTTAAAVTSTMQIVELHVKYNTTADHNPPEADHCCVGVRVSLRKGYHHSNKYYLKHIVQVLLDRGHNSHLIFVIKRQTHAVSLLK